MESAALQHVDLLVRLNVLELVRLVSLHRPKMVAECVRRLEPHASHQYAFLQAFNELT